MVVEIIESACRDIGFRVPVEVVTATRGKRVRAEPVQERYEEGRVHHVGVLRELEREMCTWTSDIAESPGRMDGLVWAVDKLQLAPSYAGVHTRTDSGGA